MQRSLTNETKHVLFNQWGARLKLTHDLARAHFPVLTPFASLELWALIGTLFTLVLVSPYRRWKTAEKSDIKWELNGKASFNLPFIVFRFVSRPKQRSGPPCYGLSLNRERKRFWKELIKRGKTSWKRFVKLLKWFSLRGVLINFYLKVDIKPVSFKERMDIVLRLFVIL